MTTLLGMRDRYYSLATNPDRQAVGFELERLLNDLFRLFGLEPRSAFRVTGEQIDGSFILDYETYLVEAKWTSQPISHGDLLIFKGKIDGKSALTRGVCVSVNGFTADAIKAITTGKQPRFFLVDGCDLAAVLEGQVQLPILLRFKLRKLTEEGSVFVPAREISA
ncbi:MAG: restriction endonuclease [Chloroflexi bacterium]|nr:restriction endonuclease [Chloroflexota bacterium]